MPYVEIREDRCKGCGLCVNFCPKSVLRISGHLNARGYYIAEQFDREHCIGCAVCARMCPDVAIAVYREEVQKV